jgi:hypothetical protein
VWRDFQAQVAAGKPWTSDTFMAAAAARTDARTAHFLNGVVNDVATQPDAMLREGMAQAGWTRPPPGSATAPGKP